MNMTTFSVIATPIGNLEDITLRALNVLRKADLVLCEDTRVTKKLLDRHDIHVKTMSYHMHSKLSRVEEIVGILRDSVNEDTRLGGEVLPDTPCGFEGRSYSPQKGVHKNIVLVSDAGTPSISDPGSELVGRIRRELAQEIESGSVKIEAIPGPSALTAALSIAGVPCAEFTFLGFLPHKKGRQTLFNEIAESERTMVFYESPHRIMKTLEALKNQGKAIPGDQLEARENPGKKITVCRELTKIFEEVVSGSAEKVLNYFTLHPDKVRGEFVVIVSIQ
jgi:16S rRNA (cytidine1402-2'-O)-methyltransferase